MGLSKGGRLTMGRVRPRLPPLSPDPEPCLDTCSGDRGLRSQPLGASFWVCSPYPRTQLYKLEEGHGLGSCEGKGQRN